MDTSRTYLLDKRSDACFGKSLSRANKHGHVPTGTVLHDDVDIIIIPLRLNTDSIHLSHTRLHYLKIIHFHDIFMFDLLQQFDFVDQQILSGFRQSFAIDAFDGKENRSMESG